MASRTGSDKNIGSSSTKPKGAGHEIGLTDPVDRGYVCQHMCECNVDTKIVDKLGRQLKQRCVTKRIQWEEEKIGNLAWRYKAEVGYYMSNPPRPLMSKDQPIRPSRFPIGRAMGDAVLLQELEGRTLKGMLRIPDLTILKVTGSEIAMMRAAGNIAWKRFIPTHENIEAICEIKFPGDRLSSGQLQDYPLIAGDGEFAIMTLSRCKCDGRRRTPQEAPVRSPITTPVQRDQVAPLRWYQPQPKPEFLPVPVPQKPAYGPVANPGHGIPLLQWVKSAADSVEKSSGVILVGTIAIAVVAAVVAAPAEAVAAAVVLVVVGVESATKKDDGNI